MVEDTVGGFYIDCHFDSVEELDNINLDDVVAIRGLILGPGSEGMDEYGLEMYPCNIIK